MTTILRVKRRNDEEPLDALILACKKRRIEGNLDCEDADSNSKLTTIVKFAGTVKNQEENVLEHLSKALAKDQLKANYKQHEVDIMKKARLQTKEDSKQSRFKVVNCFRAIDNVDEKSSDKGEMTVIDVEDVVSCQTQESPNEDDTGFAYDLYYTQEKQDLDIASGLEDFDIHSFDNFETVWRMNCDVDSNHDTDDSNSESNWRNDYPDSDNSEHSENSVDEDDMRKAVMNWNIDSDASDLSVEEDFVYALDQKDVDSYGYTYAKYKARLLDKDTVDDNSDDDDHDDDDSEYSGVHISEVYSDDEGEGKNDVKFDSIHDETPE